MITILIITLVTIVASCVGTLSGFGVGTIMTPILLLFLPISHAIFLIAIIHWFHNIWKIIFFRYGIKWDVFIYFGLPSIGASILGALLVHGHQPILLLFLGIFLIAYSIFLFISPNIKLPYTKFNALIGGGISGFLAGIFGIRGALRSVFLTSYDFSRATYLGTIGAISMLLDTTRITIYWLSGISLPETMRLGMLLFVPASFVGAYIGRYFVIRIPHEKFRFVIAVFLLIMGIWLLLTPLFGY